MRNTSLLSILLLALVVAAGCSKRTSGAVTSDLTPSPTSSPSAPPATDPQVPPKYADIATTLGKRLNAAITSAGSQHGAKQAFGAELLVANGNRGTELLSPAAIAGVDAFLDRFQQLGIQGVTVMIPYQVMLADYPRSAEYVQFYRQVAAKVRDRGMKLVVKEGVIFAGTPFSSVPKSSQALTLDAYEQGRADGAKRIISEIHPDYMSIGNEPDTDAALTGVTGITTPDGWAKAVNVILGLIGDRHDVKIGAGAGSWSPLAFHQAIATQTSVDYVTAHLYPVNDQYLATAFAVPKIAHAAGKEALLDEAWLVKDTETFPGASSMAAYADVTKRDMFSFWAPDDQLFLQLLDRLAGAGYSYVSPFWSNYFFSYLTYDPSFDNESYSQVLGTFQPQASKDVVSGALTTSGAAYRAIIAAAK